MCRQLRIKNWLVALATFGLGVAVAGVFSSGLPGTPSQVNPHGPQVKDRNETCVAANHSDVRRGFIHTERGNLIEWSIRETELKLIEVKKRSLIYSPSREKAMQIQQLRLEAKLQRLLADRQKLFREQGLTWDKPKLVYEEVCNEH